MQFSEETEYNIIFYKLQTCKNKIKKYLGTYT